MVASLRIAFALVVLLATPVFAAERQTLPGTSWSVVPPDGFTLTTDPITAFLHPSEAFLMIIDIPLKRLDMTEMAKVGTISGEGNNAMRVDEVKEMTVGGRRAFLLRGYAINRRIDMYMVQIEGETTIGMIIGAVPTGSPVPLTDVQVAVLSAIETPKSIEERAAALPYRIDNLEGMRIALILAGLGATITEGPVIDIDEAVDQPFATIFTFPDGPATIGLEHAHEVKRRILAKEPTSVIGETHMIETPRGPVLEVTYSYRHRKNGRPLSGAAWLRADGTTSVFVIIHYPTGTEYYDRLARIRDGVMVK